MKNTIESDTAPVAPRSLIQGPLTALLEWQAMAEGAYSPNTLRAQKADGAIFQSYCEARGAGYLPADPMTIREFIEDRQREGKKPATINRYVATIARAHEQGIGRGGIERRNLQRVVGSGQCHRERAMSEPTLVAEHAA